MDELHERAKAALETGGCVPRDEAMKAYSNAREDAEKSRTFALLERLDLNALSKHASSLRGGITCTIYVPPWDKDDRSSLVFYLGEETLDLNITFEDGVEWIFCARRTFSEFTPSTASRNSCLKSEYMTMKYLRAHTQVPVPEVYALVLEGEPANEVGLGYLLMQKVAGRVLSWQEWRLTATPEDNRLVMKQLAGIYAELAKHPFGKIGSIVDIDDEGNAVMGPCSGRNGWIFHGNLEGGTFVGPFTNANVWRREQIEYRMREIAAGADWPENMEGNYLLCLYMLDVVEEKFNTDDPGSFYLKNMHELGWHIVVDDQLNIISILNWGDAQVIPKEAAFSAPVMMRPTPQYFTSSNVLGENEKLFAECLEEMGEKVLAECVRDARKSDRWPGYVDGKFEELLVSFWELFGDGSEWDGLDCWMNRMRARYAEDEGLKTVLSVKARMDEEQRSNV
jgi:hypothetical protein